MSVHHIVLHLSAAHGDHLESLKGTGCCHNGICRGDGWYDVLHHPLSQLIGYSLHSQPNNKLALQSQTRQMRHWVSLSTGKPTHMLVSAAESAGMQPGLFTCMLTVMSCISKCFS